jgi:hypothetical protein
MQLNTSYCSTQRLIKDSLKVPLFLHPTAATVRQNSIHRTYVQLPLQPTALPAHHTPMLGTQQQQLLHPPA